MPVRHDPTWRDFLDELATIEQTAALLPEGDDDQQRLELCQYGLLAIVQAYQHAAATDPRYPYWEYLYMWPYGTHAGSPDIVYRFAQIEETGTYRIFGTRSDVAVLNLQLGSAPWGPNAKQGFQITLDNIDVDDLDIDADGAFEVVLSPTRPVGWTGNWWRLLPGCAAHGIWVRTIMNDWTTETEPVLHIERLDDVSVRPRPSPDELRRRFKDIARYAVESTRNWALHIRDLRERGMVNAFEVFGNEEQAGGYSTQAYWQGAFELAPDEALIIDTVVPEIVKYWNIQLTDNLYLPLDYPMRATSINGAQAQLTVDRQFYAVVSEKFPGVPNWLDTGGHRIGSILGRWNQSSSAPIPKVTKVPLTELRTHLPPDTPAISRAAHDEYTRGRARAYLRRIAR